VKIRLIQAGRRIPSASEYLLLALQVSFVSEIGGLLHDLLLPYGLSSSGLAPQPRIF